MWSRFVMSQAKHNSYFIIGMAVGLWASLALIPLEEAAAPCAAGAGAGAGAGADADEFEPRREQRPLGSGGQVAGRALQRPRYYTTELGMRGSLLTGVLSSEEALKERVPVLNRTLARLQPALKFFITASAMSSVPGLANVVGFTDTREMLKPFHALKYLADNYLEEYDFFFLVTDSSFVNARRLAALAARLSVGRHVHLGVPAPDGGQYCDLAAGVLLSNSVLRAVHAELEWCVRNSYSPHHHENLGRCVLHAAHAPCQPAALGETYLSLRVEAADAADALRPELARAVTARGAPVRALPALHAYCARAHLQRDRAAAARLRAALRRNLPRHPPAYRNTTWPAGLRADPGLAPPPPDSRFHHLRWTLFNRTHAYMPDEVRAAAPLPAAHARALALVLEHAAAWARARWPAAARVSLVEGAWRWEPATALRYRLVVRLEAAADGGGGGALRSLEVARPLGAARLVPVRYVTESARVTVLVPVPRLSEHEAVAFLARYEQLCLLQDKNTHLYVVAANATDNSTEDALAAAVGALAARHPGATVELVRAEPPPEETEAAPEPERHEAAARAALAALVPRLPRDALLLVAPPHLDFNQDFLNRVRMNTIRDEQWFLPLPFARHSQYAHPAFGAGGARPQGHAGRFPLAARAALLAVHAADWQRARAAWRGPPAARAASVLAGAPLRCVRAPDPGAVLLPRAAPPRAAYRALAGDTFRRLDLGDRAALAHLLLQAAADRD